MPIPIRLRYLRFQFYRFRLENQWMVQMGGVLGLPGLSTRIVDASIAYKLTRGFM